ncbi:hypothetical protein VSR82_38380 [Burkholderia sp. JPY481]
MNQRVTSAVARMGIDIGKSAFHVVGLDAAGKPAFRGASRLSASLNS